MSGGGSRETETSDSWSRSTVSDWTEQQSSPGLYQGSKSLFITDPSSHVTCDSGEKLL